jgi:hypothetical protein
VDGLYDILLGTPFINMIGAFADPVRQRMYYRPEWPNTANEQTVDRINSIPLRKQGLNQRTSASGNANVVSVAVGCAYQALDGNGDRDSFYGDDDPPTLSM